MSQEAILDIRALEKNFGGLRVTNNVNLKLYPGARLALIGPNGAGKTTLVNLITGALEASGGEVWLMGENISKLSAQARAQKGLIRTFQITRLFASMSVAENLSIPILHRLRAQNKTWWSRPLKAQIHDEVEALLHDLHLSERKDVAVKNLAYGEQRLVELGMALAMKPKVLLLDEPAAGVPQSESHIIMAAIDRLPKDLAVVFIEHDMDLVFRFASEIVVLVQGTVTAQGNPNDIAANEQVRAIYFGEAVV